MNPYDREILDVVLGETAEVSRLFAELRAGSLDPTGSGVCRDTYGAGEQFGFSVIEARAAALGL